MDLFRLSFFQDVEKDEFGNIKSCKMHDLAISVAGDNFSTSNFGMTRIKEKTQHMSYLVSYIMQDFSPLRKAKKIRTILTQDDTYFFEEELDAVFHNLRCLRVLNVSGLDIDELPSSIYKLKHLRFLNLCDNHFIRKLPNSITHLRNLQVLNIRGCSSLKQLPNNIKKLINLTDLDNDKCNELTHMPRGIGKLTRLETLSKFKIAKDNSIFRRSGGLDELHGLNKLKGSLEITNLRYLKNVASEFKAANLNAKKQLENLKLNWIDFQDIEDWVFDQDIFNNFIANDEMGLEALRPHQSFENGGSSSFFPSLTDLTLKYCPNLKGFVRCQSIDVGMKPSSVSMEELPCFPRLSRLVIRNCPNLTYMPLFPELKILKLKEDGIKSLMEVVKMTTSLASVSTSSPFSTLSQLEHLVISKTEDCPADELLQYLPSLQQLEFADCSFKGVSSDENDDSLQWRSLKVLRSVDFSLMENLVCLPKGLQYVTTLQRLQIYHCDTLASIPEWMGDHIALQHLTIYKCLQLSERCKNNTAEDWLKISHIPNISIDEEIIQRNGCYLL